MNSEADEPLAGLVVVVVPVVVPVPVPVLGPRLLVPVPMPLVTACVVLPGRFAGLVWFVTAWPAGSEVVVEAAPGSAGVVCGVRRGAAWAGAGSAAAGSRITTCNSRPAARTRRSSRGSSRGSRRAYR